MISTVDIHVEELEIMKEYPKMLFYIGNLSLIQKPKIAIVGTRKPINYTKSLTYEIAQKLSHVGVCIVSGGAMGVDAIAHQGSGFANTIMVSGTGLDIRYPAVNQNLIKEIETQGLVLSQFPENTPSAKWNFPLRNEVVVALSQVLVITQADLKSGSMRSAEFAMKMGKPIYVLPHRIGDSDGTNMLLKQNLATPIYDIDTFVSQFGTLQDEAEDTFLQYCKSNPLYNDATQKYGEKVFEYEFLGKIVIENGRLKLA
ncbi:MAG: DNA-protecting protein DprA [Sulfurospirillaceae bacterium]|nr:DNA-protecting protein DprA [Sulfurospirillaceae bacterium]